MPTAYISYAKLVGLLVFSLCGLFPRAYASPIPGTSSSVLTAEEKGLYLSVKGFHLGTHGTTWKATPDKSLNQGEVGTSWRFNNTQAPSALAHLKTDFLKADLTLEAYAKRWMKDYSHLGMDVLGSRSFSNGTTRGVVVDLVQPKKKLQLRQAVFMHKRLVVILTCSDTQTSFESTLNECNRLIKNFNWNEVHSLQKN